MKSENPAAFILPHIRDMKGYAPGLQINDDSLLKLNTNENPFPASDKVRKRLIACLQKDRLHLYPPPRADNVRAAIAAKYDRSADCILIGNGSDEILRLVFSGVMEEGEGLVTLDPTYSLYPVLAEILGVHMIYVALNRAWEIDKDRLIAACTANVPRRPLTIIANPNAPTGIAAPREVILEIVENNPNLTLIDEAYIEFGGESMAAIAGTKEFPRLMTCNTFSKAYSLAGQRIGWLVAHPKIISELDKIRDSYNLSLLAQEAALAALDDEAEMIKRTKTIRATRKFFAGKLAKLGFTVLPSDANFIFVSPPSEEIRPSRAGDPLPETMALKYHESLRDRKILVRYFATRRLSDFVRISIGTREQMERVLEVTREFLGR